MPNKELLLQIADLIEHETDGGPTYDQNSWGRVDDGFLPISLDDIPKKKKPLCNTSACIAGWAAILSDYTEPRVELLTFRTGMAAEGTHYITGYNWAKAPTLLEVTAWEVRHDALHWSRLNSQVDRIGENFQLNITEMGLFLLDLGPDYESLFDGSWMPLEGMTVPEALRAIADGASLAEVTWRSPWETEFNEENEVTS